MKWLSVPALLAAVLFSLVVTIPFHPLARTRAPLFALEIDLAAGSADVAQLFYDLGEGYRETDSVHVPLAAAVNGAPQRCRFPIPAGNYRSFRLDPLSRAGSVTVHGPLRLVSSSGRLMRTLDLTLVKPVQELVATTPAPGRLALVAPPGSTDPQLAVTFSPPLAVGTSLPSLLVNHVPRAAAVFLPLALLLFLADRAPRLRARVAAAVDALAARPARAIALVAALAVVASAYPVVFLGKSYFSPNLGTVLLYEGYPSLPGDPNLETAHSAGSDIGAAMWQHVPYSFLQYQALSRGEAPLWNRHHSLGTPLLAQGQSMFGDPLHLFVIGARGAAWAWDLKYLLAKWLFASGVALLAFALTRPPLASPLPHSLLPALLVAATAPFIGFYLYRINHASIFSLGYAPWVLYSWLRFAHAPSHRAAALWLAALVAASFALYNSGTVKEAALLLLQMHAAGVGLLLVTGQTWRVRLTKLAAAAWVGVLLIMVLAPVWLPFLQTLRQAYTVSAHAVADQIQPSLLLGVFDELFFRPLSRESIVFNPALNSVFLLGLLYFLATLRLHFSQRPVFVLALCAVVSAAFVFGLVPPHVIIRIPFLANIGHIDNCFLCGLLVFVPLLAAVGFATAMRRLRTPEGTGDLMIAGALLLVIVAGWIGFGQAAHRMIYGVGTMVSVVSTGEVIPVKPFVWGSLAALLLAGLGLALVARRTCMRGAFTPATALLAALGVIVLVWRQGAHAAALGFEPWLLQPPARADFHAPSPAIAHLQEAVAREPARVFGLHANLTPGWNSAYGLEAIYGPDALQNTWVRQLIDVSPVKWNSSWRLYVPAREVAAARPFLDALNVRYYVDMVNDRETVARTLRLRQSADLDIFESPTAWPRAYFTDRIETYDAPADLMPRLLARNGVPLAAVQRADTAAAAVAATLPTLSPASAEPTPVVAATGYALRTNSTSFTVRASGPGLAVLHEAWWPDSFQAEVDGRRVPIIRVNHAFQAVPIASAGEHRVTFSYWPRHFVRALLCSSIGAVILLLSFLLALRPARPA